MEKYLAFINGRHVEHASGEYIDVENPATGEIFAKAAKCGETEVDMAVSAAKKAQKSWAALSVVERAGHLKNLAALLRKKSGDLGRIVTMEQGKQISIGSGEAAWGADLMEYHAEWARRIEGEIIQSDSPFENIFLYKEPVGVCACILPWNFPVYVLIRKLSPALITGNAVVLKPSSETPISALVFAEICKEAGIPDGVVNAVSGDGSVVGKRLASHPDVGLVTLTGSTEAGRQVMTLSARNLARVSLELGGKAPAVVMNDADLDLAVSSIHGGRLSNAGQVCNCVERVYVQEGVYDEFIRRMTEAFGTVKIGNGMDDPDMGPLISGKALEAVGAMVKRAVDDGALIVTGGKPAYVMEKGYFYEPTILVNCRQDMEIVQEEIFGPVLPVLKFKTVDEAIALANDSKYGLTATLYTENYRTAMRFANEIESGELYINRRQGEAYQGYHAGWKLSGIGGDDGKHCLDAFMKTRVVYMKY